MYICANIECRRENGTRNTFSTNCVVDAYGNVEYMDGSYMECTDCSYEPDHCGYCESDCLCGDHAVSQSGIQVAPGFSNNVEWITEALKA